MTSFLDFCLRHVRLDAAAASELAGYLCTRQYASHALVLRPGQVCGQLYFMEQGLAKTFFVKSDKEFIMQFFAEAAMFTVLDSFLLQAPSTYGIATLEPAIITSISKHDLDVLCARHHNLETFFRKLVSQASIKMMKRISEMLEENASERYAHFMVEYPQLAQRISLGNLANYLGITQVTLSRIRAKN